MPNFLQVGQKLWVQNSQHWSFWLVGLVGREVVVGISNSFYIVLVPLLASIPNFIQIGQKTQKLEIFSICWLWLVGLVSRKNVVDISNSFQVISAPLSAPIPNFIQIGWKIRKLKILFRSKNGRSDFIWHKDFESNKCRLKFTVTITIPDRFIFERILKRRFS